MGIAGPLVLAQVPLFAELTADELAVLGASLRRRAFGKGEVIFLRGDPGTSLYVVESGRIRIVLSSPDGKEMVLALLGPADFFGDLALLDGEPRSADALAQESGQLLVLRREDFLSFLEVQPGVGARLLAILSRRLRRNAQLIQDAAFLDIPGRLARVLLELAYSRSEELGMTQVSPTRLTQTDLASMIGASRESVNKWLRVYRRKGLINFQRGVITVLKPDELRSCIG